MTLTLLNRGINASGLWLAGNSRQKYWSKALELCHGCFGLPLSATLHYKEILLKGNVWTGACSDWLCPSQAWQRRAIHCSVGGASVTFGGFSPAVSTFGTHLGGLRSCPAAPQGTDVWHFLQVALLPSSVLEETAQQLLQSLHLASSRLAINSQRFGTFWCIRSSTNLFCSSTELTVLKVICLKTSLCRFRCLQHIHHQHQHSSLHSYQWPRKDCVMSSRYISHMGVNILYTTTRLSPGCGVHYI